MTTHPETRERALEKAAERAAGLLHSSVREGHDKASFARGVRYSITWLHDRARSMNDPHAVAVLNAAAFNLGIDLKDRYPSESDNPPKVAG